MGKDNIGAVFPVNVDSSNQLMKNHSHAEQDENPLISSRQAAQMLGVSLRTLYAYISRGKVGRILDPETGASLFNRAEIADYVRRRDRGRSPRNVARASLDFGLPVLESHVCAIRGGRPWFRGIDAIQLSKTATLEDTAALLWKVDRLPDAAPAGLPDSRADGQPFAARFAAWLLAQMNRAAATDTAYTYAPLVAQATTIFRAAVALATQSRASAALAHERLAHAWGLPPAHAQIIRRALVLHADHELNPSSFVVRCTASTMANPYAAALAGCCAASGAKHANFSRAYRLIGQVLKADPPARIDDAMPGFNHPLYPKGDPRAIAILADLRQAAAGPEMSAIDSFLLAVRADHGLLPKNDFALAAMAHILKLPADTCQAIFIVARVAGWNAHALEQYASPFLIRPRAQYVPD
ncbi:citrate synthase family protein [Bordetella petrii]